MNPPANQEPPDLNLDNVRVFAPRDITNTPGEDTSLETQTLKKEQLRVELEKLRAELDSFTQDIRQRRSFAPKLYVLTCCWLASVLVILLTQGVSEGGLHFFHLNDGVLVALLGTTTVNVVGLFYVVAKYLFPEKGNRLERESELKRPD